MKKITRQEAKAVGLKRYYTGIPCKHGHDCEKRVSDYGCVRCSTVKMLRFFQTPEGKLAHRARVNKKYHTSAGRALWAVRRRAYNQRLRRTPFGKMRRKFRVWLNGSIKSTKMTTLVGCSPEFLRMHLERLWKPGMTWDNHGTGSGCWHIDHIRPISSFDPTDRNHQFQAFHYSNLQPLWEMDNIAKGARLDYPINGFVTIR